MAQIRARDVIRATLVAVFFVIQGVIPDADGAKILVLISHQQPSQIITKLGVGSELIKRGHEVYFALSSGYPKKDAVLKAGVKIVEYPEAPDVLYMYSAEFHEKLEDSIFNRTDANQISFISLVTTMVEDDCQTIMANEAYITRLKALQFDLAIVDPFIINPCFLIVPHYLGIPFVSAAAFVFPFSMGIPALPSFFATAKTSLSPIKIPNMNTFWERLSNTVNTLAEKVFLVDSIWDNIALLEKYAPEIDSWEQLLRLSEIILIENDFHLDNALPLLPHVVTVAGSTATPPKPLPENLEKLMKDSGEHGVILASFGSSAYNMPVHMAIKFLEAYGRLNETVLTKMAVPAGVKVPNNVHMLPWQPQNDILGHPKTKLFITHCGSGSQHEALFHGVPMLGIPMYAEQGWNCARAQRRGIALCLDLMTFTADELYDNIRELIDNSTFKTTMQKLSAIFRDEPMDGSQKAAFWIDHVIKFGGSHLRSPALDQPIYQLLMLDILGFLLLVVVIFIIVIIVTFRALLNKFLKLERKHKHD